MSDQPVATEGTTPTELAVERSDGVPSRKVGVAPSRLIPAVFGLTTLAIAQPVLDLFARQPQFLVAHGLAPWEVVVLAVLIVVVPALLFTAVAAIGARFYWLTVLVVGLPLLLIALHIGSRLGADGVLLIVAAAMLALLGSGLYTSYGWLQDPASFLAVVPVIVLAYFFAVLPTAVLAEGVPASEVALTEVGNPVPVVIVVFDELPIASLIDSQGEILTEQFPSFARLSADGVWYRNAITVETRTTESVPAILSGVQIPDGLVPNAASHPRTLLTLLARSHDVEAIEPVTELCPDEICPVGESATGVGRWSTVLSDAGVVYGHLVVPIPWRDQLPTIDENWTGFAAAAADGESSWNLQEAMEHAVASDRRQAVARFLASLGDRPERPPLRMAHFALPHRPWEFLPDGSRHGQDEIEGYGRRGWGPDEFLVADGWRRHLLQVGYSDTMLGQIIDQLEKAGRYNSTLIVVAADHGVRFRAGIEDMRVTNEESYGSILPIPLFVKYPAGLPEGPPAGTIDDRRVETIDIAPTVLDVLDADPGDVEFQGRSLLSDFKRNRSRLQLRGEPFIVDAEGEEKLAVAREKEAWFPAGDPWSLVPDPSLRPLIGRPLPTGDDPGVELDTAPGFRPPLFEGRITSEKPLSDGEFVALTSNGVVVAITKAIPATPNEAAFSFLIDPSRTYEPPFQSWLLVDGTRLIR